MPWQLEYDGATPMLPEPIGLEVETLDPTVHVSQELFAARRRLLEGCYLVRLKPRFPAWRRIDGKLRYDGTLRLQWDGAHLLGSGDLYLYRTSSNPPERTAPWEIDPSQGIPIFPRDQYRYYLRLTGVRWRRGDVLTLESETYRFDRETATWTRETTLFAEVTPRSAPQGYPKAAGWPHSHFLAGPVRNRLGTRVAELEMGWVSPYLRRGVVEIDAAKNMEMPEDNGAGIGWKEIYEPMGWLMEAKPGNTDLPAKDVWSKTQLHKHMLKWRDQPADLDREWRYHLLCVSNLWNNAWGVMYDDAGSDSGNVPREGAAVAARRTIPNEKVWGDLQGKVLGKEPRPYFRTAVHEIGHAQHLFHNPLHGGFMQKIRDTAGRPGRFPEEIEWYFSQEDARRLRHMPDPWVRPGGLSWGHGYVSSPVAEEDLIEAAPHLSLEVRPCRLPGEAAEDLHKLPFGAPLRLRVRLASEGKMSVPEALSLKSGQLTGEFVDPSGTARSFVPLVLTVDEPRFRVLAGKQEMVHELTLLRGSEGALLPVPGYYRVVVHLTWDTESRDLRLLRVTGRSALRVEPPETDKQERAALAVLDTPNIMLPLVFGASQDDGVDALKKAVDDAILGPHYAVIEAKRLAGQATSLKHFAAAAKLIDERSVLTGAESLRLAEIVEKAAKRAPRTAPKNPQIIRLLTLLAVKIQDDDISDEARKQIGRILAAFGGSHLGKATEE